MKKMIVLLLILMSGLWFCMGKTPEAKVEASSRTNVVLYVLNPSYDNLTIPPDYPQQFQISLNGSAKVTYMITEGHSVTVSDTGLVKPESTTYYWRDGIGSTYNDGGNYDSITTEYSYGTSIVTATTGSTTYEYAVTVADYADVYADQVMDKYLADYIRPGMSDMEKLEVIAKFPCQYDYSPYHSSAAGMIISGGGDCWASTDAILQLAEKVGLKARQRAGKTGYGFVKYCGVVPWNKRRME